MVNIKNAIEIAKPLIKNYEGLASTTPAPKLTLAAKNGNPNQKIYAYWDNYAKLYTIGWGSIYLNGKRVKQNDVITRSQAETLFEKEIIEREKLIRNKVNLNKLNENQYAVLISIAYNAGPGGLSATKILPAINAGKPAAEVAAIIKDSLTTSKGVKVPGLVRRRKEESNFFLQIPALLNNKLPITILILSLSALYFFF